MTDIRSQGGSVWARAANLREELMQRFATYRMYRKTLNELRGLSRRELDDLGLAYADLQRVAYHAAYK